MKRRRLFLVLASGLLLGLAYPPVPTGLSAFVAFVPFFMLYEEHAGFGRGIRTAYAVFFVMNLLTVYWAGGFTHGRDVYLMIAGALLLVAHPLFFCVPIAGFIALRKAFGHRSAVIAFPLLWVAFEYAHSLTELSFPWLMLANTQSYAPESIRFIAVTGAYGASFWILAVNILLYFAATESTSGRQFRPTSRATLLALAAAMLFVLPRFLPAPGGAAEDAGGNRESLSIAIVQPNIDPFEKWENAPDSSIHKMIGMTRDVGIGGADLVLWPETAIPYYVTRPNPRLFPSYVRLTALIDSLGVPLVTGVPEFVYYPKGGAVPPSAKKDAAGSPYDTYNGAYLIAPGTDTVQHYEKMRLVPFAERVPFSDQLSGLNAMRWNFGLGGWGIGKDTTIFSFRTRRGSDARFATLICYESVYPGFTAAFVRKGAQFLVVLTNDSWWGRTSGAYQHREAAVLRAIENRRWVVQCANGGISFAVDPDGRFHEKSGLFTERLMNVEITPSDAVTIYSRNGDWFAGIASLLTLMGLAAAFVVLLQQRMLRKG